MRTPNVNDTVRIVRKYKDEGLINQFGAVVGHVDANVPMVKVQIGEQTHDLIVDALEPLMWTLLMPNDRSVRINETQFGRLLVLGRAVPVHDKWATVRLAYEFAEDDPIVAETLEMED